MPPKRKRAAATSSSLKAPKNAKAASKERQVSSSSRRKTAAQLGNAKARTRTSKIQKKTRERASEETKESGGGAAKRPRSVAAIPSPEPPRTAERTEKLATATMVQSAVADVNTKGPAPATSANVDKGNTGVKDAEGKEVVSAADTNQSSGPSPSLLRRYLPLPSSVPRTPWNTSDATVFSTFLAQLHYGFVRSCCQLLAKLTTSTSPAFLHVAALGEAALSAAADPEVGKTAGASSESLAHASRDVDAMLNRQEQAYRTVRATIAASCTLGHRSCQVLWGPRGSGKHRIMRLLAQEVRRTPNTFVMELHGRLLRDDEAALGVIAQQLFSFLQSPQSTQLREAHYLLRTGSFGFGQLFHFERRMQEAATAPALPPSSDAARKESAEARGRASGARGAAAQSRASRKLAAPAGARRGGLPRRRRAEASLSPDYASNSEDDERIGSDGDVDGGGADDDLGNAEMMVTSTTTYLTGGAASALPHLQRALLLLKSQGCNIVVCIRDVDVFGIRCDQLLYVLSGLMHDSDGSGNSGGGGGLSLVLASAAPDIRQLEKRLSSRLTCETRYVPLLPWSLAVLLAATLHVAAQDASFQLRLRELGKERSDMLASLRDGATRLRRLHEGLPRRGVARKAQEKAMKEVQDEMAGFEARLHAVEAGLRDARAQRRHFLGFLDADPAGTTTTTAATHRFFVDGGTSGGGGAAALGSLTASEWWPGSPLLTSQATVASSSQQQPTTSSASFVAPRSWTVAALHRQPNLALEAQCVMCEELLRQLRLATIATSSVAEHHVDSEASSSLVPHVTSLGAAIELESGTSATVLTALTSALCKTASGEVDLMGARGRRVLLQWMRARLQHEVIPPPAEEEGGGVTDAAKVDHATCPPGLPAKILTRWRESAHALAPSKSSTPASATTRVGGVTEDWRLSSTAAAATAVQPPYSLSSPTTLKAAAQDGTQDASSSPPPPDAAAAVFHRSGAALDLPPLSLLPPHLFDLFAEGQLVGMGYGSREVMLVLFYMHLHYSTGVRQRTVADLIEDVSSSLGTRAAASLDREAIRCSIRLLCRWRLLTVVERQSQSVQLCGSDVRLREFLATVLSKQPAWCEAELGLDTREIMRFRNLV
ncbi:hypothetical protein N2W54_003044 [Lotmaria passim]